MISFELIFPAGSKSFGGTQRFYVEFKKHENGCIVQWYNKRKLMRKFLEDRDFVTAALHDFQNLMTHQKSILSMFRLEFEYHRKETNRMEVDRKLEPIANILLSKIKEILNFRPLKVEDLSMSVIRQEQVLEILPFIDPKFIRKIKLDGKKSFPMNTFEVDQLEKLEQWKNAKELKIWRYDMSIPIERFSNFQKVQLFSQTITTESILSLKNTFLLPSCNIENFSIKYKFIDDLRFLTHSFGPFMEETDQYGVNEKRWIMKVPRSLKMLSISIFSSSFITFERVERGQISLRIRPLD